MQSYFLRLCLCLGLDSSHNDRQILVLNCAATVAEILVRNIADSRGGCARELFPGVAIVVALQEQMDNKRKRDDADLSEDLSRSAAAESKTAEGSPPRERTKKRQDYMGWDDYFMSVAFLSAQRSKGISMIRFFITTSRP